MSIKFTLEAYPEFEPVIDALYDMHNSFDSPVVGFMITRTYRAIFHGICIRTLLPPRDFIYPKGIAKDFCNCSKPSLIYFGKLIIQQGWHVDILSESFPESCGTLFFATEGFALAKNNDERIQKIGKFYRHGPTYGNIQSRPAVAGRAEAWPAYHAKLKDLNDRYYKSILERLAIAVRRNDFTDDGLKIISNIISGKINQHLKSPTALLELKKILGPQE